MIRMLTSLIDQALAGNRELKILNEDVQIASNEILARSGAYLPFVTYRGRRGAEQIQPLHAGEEPACSTTRISPASTFPIRCGNFLGRPQPHLAAGHLAGSCGMPGTRRRSATSPPVERRNYFVTRLVAEIAENYYRLMALDKRLENLDQIIELQEQSLEIAKARKEAARGTELAVLRFQAEVRKEPERKADHQSGRSSRPRTGSTSSSIATRSLSNAMSAGFFDLNIHALSVGVPSQLLQNRPDIRQAERELAAAGLDVKVARANFFPQLVHHRRRWLQSFNPKSSVRVRKPWLAISPAAWSGR